MSDNQQPEGLKQKYERMKALTARVFAQYIPDTKGDKKLEELKRMVEEK